MYNQQTSIFSLSEMQNLTLNPDLTESQATLEPNLWEIYLHIKVQEELLLVT